MAIWNDQGISTSSSITLTNINAAGEEIKVSAYNGLDCFQDSLIFTVNVSPTITTVSLNDNLTGHTSCEGDNIVFSAIGSGNWYQYLREFLEELLQLFNLQQAQHTAQPLYLTKTLYWLEIIRHP